MTKKKILVTGADGQLGNEIRVLAKTSEHQFVFTDIQELDITDRNQIRELVATQSIEIIINCAAYTNVDKAESDEKKCNLINHLAVENLATVCQERGLFLFHISTDYVFHGNKNVPLKENEPTNPIGIYGKTKLAGEESIKLSGCNYFIFRTAWLYSSFGKNFLKTMRQLMLTHQQIKVVFDQVGTPTYAANLAFIICSIINKNQYQEKKEIYHFSNEGVCSWYDFAQSIKEGFNLSCKIKPCYTSEFPSPATRPSFSVLDKNKLKTDFQLEVPYWRDALSQCINLLEK